LVFTKLIQISDRSVKTTSGEGGGTPPLEDARELRKLAEWYRAFAEVGNSAARRSRLEFAEFLERRADALERPAADDPKKI
jgi:hypothetical protein